MKGVASLAVVVAIVLPCVAIASRSPTPSERSALDRTVIAYIDTAQGHCCVRGLHAQVTAIRISASDPAWAVVVTRLRDSSGQEVQGAALVMHHVRSQWRVENMGTSALGCGVPKAISDDLQLTCPLTTMPDVKGKGYVSAVVALSRAYLCFRVQLLATAKKKGTIVRVLRQSPLAGTRVRAWSVATLTVPLASLPAIVAPQTTSGCPRCIPRVVTH